MRLSKTSGGVQLHSKRSFSGVANPVSPRTAADAKQAMGFMFETHVIGISDLDGSLECKVSLFVHFLVPALADARAVRAGELAAIDEAGIPVELIPKFDIVGNKHGTEQDSKVWRLDLFGGVVLGHLTWHCCIGLDLQLHRFPFDRHCISVQVQCSNRYLKAWEHSNKPQMFPNTAFRCRQNWSSAWRLHHAQLRLETRPTRRDIVGELYMERESAFFLWNVVLVLFFCVQGTQVAVAIAPDEVGDRVQITLTLLLTAVAFKFVMIQFVPPVGYLTYLDKYALVAFTFQSFALFENFIVSGLVLEDAETDLATDRMFGLVFSLVWCGLHVVGAVCLGCGIFHVDWSEIKRVAARGPIQHDVKECTELNTYSHEPGRVLVAVVSVSNAMFNGKQAFEGPIEPALFTEPTMIETGKVYRGKVVVASPMSGVERLANEKECAGAIVVMRRGGCQFETKALHAHRAGAAVLLIANNRADDPHKPAFVTGTSFPGQLSCPVFAIPQAAGDALASGECCDELMISFAPGGAVLQTAHVQDEEQRTVQVSLPEFNSLARMTGNQSTV
jgi:hypothetical protein